MNRMDECCCLGGFAEARERMNTFSNKVKEVAAVETVKELKTALTAYDAAACCLPSPPTSPFPSLIVAWPALQSVEFGE